MATDPEALYLQLGQLVAEMPQLDGPNDLTTDEHRWLGQVTALVSEISPGGETNKLIIAIDHLGTVLRHQNAMQICAIVHRAMALANARAPAAARGSYVAIGAGFDALKAVGKVLAEAKSEVHIVDPYMDAKVLTDFAPLAPENVAVRLLCDQFYTKAGAVQPAAARWVAQFANIRPLEVRLSAPRALHDRLIIVDQKVVWSLTQSLKDFAGRSPATVMRMDPELAAMKVQFVESIWHVATPV